MHREFHEKYEVARAKEEPISLYEEEMQPTVCERYSIISHTATQVVYHCCLMCVGLFMSSR